MRVRYDFFVTGYVVMPEHVHLLLSEPKLGSLAKALQAVKLSVAVQRSERPFWTGGPFKPDFGLSGAHQEDTLCRNAQWAGGPGWNWVPHVSGLQRGFKKVKRPRSLARYQVETESPWIAVARDQALYSHISEAGCRAPSC